MIRRDTFLLLGAILGVLAIFLSRNNSPKESKRPTQWPGRNQTVLFMSNSEPGLANVLFATSHALISEYRELEVHFATFPSRAADISTISKSSPKSKPMIFHSFKGQNYGTAIQAHVDDGKQAIDEVINPPGLAGLSKLCENMQKFLMPWGAKEYLSLYHEALRVLEEVDPVIVVIEPLFGPGLDAIRATGRNHVIISPNSLKDNFADKEPWLSILWKYPAISSGYPYPVPLHLIPANLYMNARFIYSVLNTPALSKKKAFLKANGIAKPLDLFTVYHKDYLWLSQSSLECDFPLSAIPDNVLPCGPIFLSSGSAKEQDAELAAWLDQAPTVLINLGSAVNYNEYISTEMAKAIKIVLATTEVQVLWKFNKRGDFENDFLADLQGELKEGRLRLEKWLKPDPAAMLETGNIVLSVHHGGANCFHEAVGTGIPQMVLPMWVDLYDNAVRAEFLGIGVWGSKMAAPNWTADELGEAFLRVLGDAEEAVKIRKKAYVLGKVFQKDPGRVRAAREIAKLARQP